MKNEYLLVDGYNIIFAWENLKEIADTSSLEIARGTLINLLSNYQGYKGINLIIVFDAHLVKGSLGSVEKIGDISIIYTKEAETADNYIEKVATELVKDYTVKVATSDRTEQMIIMGKGAIRVSALELKSELEFTNKKIKNKIEKQKSIKNNMLFDNLDPKMAEVFEKMRRMK